MFSQGYGTRRVCRDLLRSGQVEFRAAGSDWQVLRCEDLVQPRGGSLRLGGRELPWVAEVYLALNKPADYECSHRPQHHPSVFSLLPPPWVNRGLQVAGRLDADTTGLVIATTDGGFAHAITSPKRHCQKTYRVKHDGALSATAIEALTRGLLLRGESRPTRPAEVETLEPGLTRLRLHEGKYHQVKRMFAACGHAVLALHREGIGPVMLEDSLEPGAWRLLSSEDVDILSGQIQPAP